MSIAARSSVSTPSRRPAAGLVNLSRLGFSRTLSSAWPSASSTRSISPRSARVRSSHSVARFGSGASAKARPSAIWASRSAIWRLSSPTASLAGCNRSGAKTRPAASPAAAPMSVSVMRLVAAACESTEKISIALIGTSRMSSRSRRTRPSTSAPAMSRPSTHQLNGTYADTATAASTPAVTPTTRWTALRIVWNRVACTTSSAVSGASTSRDDAPGSRNASRYANTAVSVSRVMYTAVGWARRRTSVSCSAWRLATALAASPTLSPGTWRTRKPFMDLHTVELVGSGRRYSSTPEQNTLRLIQRAPRPAIPRPVTPSGLSVTLRGRPRAGLL